MATVVIGAGIVGVSTAYYLSEHQAPESVHLVEATATLFASASGFAGGFLARDWMAPAAAELAALSFEQHRLLAERLDGATRWGYGTSTALSYGLPEPESEPARPRRRGEDWLRQGTSRATAAPSEAEASASASAKPTPPPTWLSRRAGDRLDVLADDGSTGQVDPQRFCASLLEACRARGVQLHQPARVVAVHADGEGRLAGVTVEAAATTAVTTTTRLACTRLVVTAGAWTPQVLDALFAGRRLGERLPVTNYAGHSAVVRLRSTSPTPSASHAAGAPLHAVFASGGALAYCPEIFARANGTLYCAGLNADAAAEPLPPRASDAAPDAAKLDDLLCACRAALGWGADVELDVLRTGLCHRPATPWGTPVVARLPDDTVGLAAAASPSDGGVYVAAGHGPWGISMGPGTGMVLAELVQGRPLSADLSGLGLRT